MRIAWPVADSRNMYSVKFDRVEYIVVCTYVCVYRYVCTYVSMYIHYICMYVLMFVCIYALQFTPVHMWIPLCMLGITLSLTPLIYLLFIYYLYCFYFDFRYGTLV